MSKYFIFKECNLGMIHPYKLHVVEQTGVTHYEKFTRAVICNMTKLSL